MKKNMLKLVFLVAVVVSTGSAFTPSTPLLDGMPAPGCDTCNPLPVPK